MSANMREERHYGCRIELSGTYKGMRTLVMQNEKIRLSLLLDKGTDIFELLYKPKDVDFLWRSPQGMRGPSTQVSIAHPQGSFLDAYHGGWQELFPSASGPSFYRGAMLGMHGEVACLPWDCKVIRNDPDAVEVLLQVHTLRTPFLLEKRIRLEAGQAVVTFRETVKNCGRTDMRFMWGHHPAFGAPFLSEDCYFQLPSCTILTHGGAMGGANRFLPGRRFAWPWAVGKDGNAVDLRLIQGREAGFTDMMYATGFAEGWFSLLNRRMGVGVGMAWPADHFPYVWLWQEFSGTMDYPWYGNAYTFAIEPFTSLPGSGEQGLTEAIENGTAAAIRPHEEISKQFTLVVFETREPVQRIDPSGRVEFIQETEEERDGSVLL